MATHRGRAVGEATRQARRRCAAKTHRSIGRGRHARARPGRSSRRARRPDERRGGVGDAAGSTGTAGSTCRCWAGSASTAHRAARCSRPRRNGCWPTSPCTTPWVPTGPWSRARSGPTPARPRPRANLRSALWRLRRVDERLVTSHGQHLHLGPEVGVDVRDLEALAERVLHQDPASRCPTSTPPAWPGSCCRATGTRGWCSSASGCGSWPWPPSTGWSSCRSTRADPPTRCYRPGRGRGRPAPGVGGARAHPGPPRLRQPQRGHPPRRALPVPAPAGARDRPLTAVAGPPGAAGCRGPADPRPPAGRGGGPG